MADGFMNEWVLTGRQAAAWAQEGVLVFGPGPRHWTWTERDGSGAVFMVLRHTGDRWYLRKVREWQS